MDNILKTINSTPKNIEELCEVKDYIASLKDKMEGVDKAISQVLDYMTLLEKYQCKQTEDDFKTWDIFGKPLEITECKSIACHKL